MSSRADALAALQADQRRRLENPAGGVARSLDRYTALGLAFRPGDMVTDTVTGKRGTVVYATLAHAVLEAP